MKKIPGDIIILLTCTKNHDHTLYCSWDIVHDGYNCYFSFWVTFCSFTLPLTLNSPKMKFFKKMKKEKRKHLEILFYTSVPKLMIICRTALKTWCMTDVIIFHFGLFFALLLLQQLKKSKFQKMRKTPGYVIILHVSQRWWLDDVWYQRYGTWQMDGWTDEQKKVA